MRKSTHLHHGDSKRTSAAKVKNIVGHTDNYQYPTDRAHDMANTAYYENTHLDPLTLPTRDMTGPMGGEGKD